MIPILIQSISMFFNFVRFLLIARIILSWISMGRGGGPITAIIFGLTEPILAPVRNILHKSPLGGPGMMIDFSPLIVFILLPIIEGVVINLLRSI